METRIQKYFFNWIMIYYRACICIYKSNCIKIHVCIYHTLYEYMYMYVWKTDSYNTYVDCSCFAPGTNYFPL